MVLSCHYDIVDELRCKYNVPLSKKDVILPWLVPRTPREVKEVIEDIASLEVSDNSTSDFGVLVIPLRQGKLMKLSVLT